MIVRAFSHGNKRIDKKRCTGIIDDVVVVLQNDDNHVGDRDTCNDTFYMHKAVRVFVFRL